MPGQRPPTLVFDLDGTLLDVSARHHHVYSTVCRSLGGQPLDRAAYWHLKRRRTGWPEILAQSGLDDAEVTLTTGYDDAVKIQKGELDANAAFMQGKVKVTGNMAKVMSLLPITNSPEYKQLQVEIAAITEF